MVVRFLVIALALGVATWLLPGITLEDGPLADRAITIVIVAAIFGLVNTLARPMFRYFRSPLLFVLMGLAILVVNAILLLLTSWVCDRLGVGWGVTNFWWALAGALMVSTVSFVLTVFVGRRGVEHR